MLKFYVQWGSEIGPFKIWKHLKSVLFEGRISNGPDHSKTGKNGGFSLDCFILNNFLIILKTVKAKGTIQNPDHLKCLDFRSPLYLL